MSDNEQPEAEKVVDETTPVPEAQPDTPEEKGKDDLVSKYSPEELADQIKLLRKENKKRRDKNDEYETQETERKAAEKKALEEKQKEQGKYQELLAEREKELEIAKAKAERLDALEESLRADLLERIPKKNRETYEGVPLDILKKIVEDFVSNGANGSVKDEPPDRKAEPANLDSLSPEELAALFSTNPELARELMRKAGQKNAKTYR